jgi:hypothetical protein
LSETNKTGVCFVKCCCVFSSFFFKIQIELIISWQKNIWIQKFKYIVFYNIFFTWYLLFYDLVHVYLLQAFYILVNVHVWCCRIVKARDCTLCKYNNRTTYNLKSTVCKWKD